MNVWIQVRHSTGWVDVIAAPEGELAKSHLDRLKTEHGESNVRIKSREPAVRFTCSCQDLNGKSMVYCPRHAEEYRRRSRALRDSIADALSAYAARSTTAPIVRNILNYWVGQIRKGGELLCASS